MADNINNKNKGGDEETPKGKEEVAETPALFNAVDCASQLGLYRANSWFINRKYSLTDLKTVEEWKKVFADDKVI